jgi:tetratricopeptide (TPR) repeat protein
MLRKATWATGFICLLMVLGGQIARAQFGQMTGTVKDEDGKPAANMIVYIDRDDIKGHYEVKTDKNGKFFHAGLPLGKFSVSVKTRSGQMFKAISGIQTRLSEPAVADIDLQQYKMQSEAQAAGVNVAPQQGNKLSQEQMAQIEKAAKDREEQMKKRQELTGKFDNAMQAMKDKRYDEAIPQFQAAADVDPTQHVIFAQLGEAYAGKATMAKNSAEKKENYDKSVEAYQKALNLKPDDPSYHNNYALALANDGKVDDAQAELVKAAQLDPTNAGRYYFNLGAVLVNTNHMKEAADAFKKATESDPNFADAYYQLGVSLTGMAAVDPKTGKVQPVPGTVEALQKYLQLAPTGPNADAAKGLLATMTGAVQTQVELEPQKGKKK